MRIALLVYFLCHFVEAVVQDKTGKSTEQKLFLKPWNGVAKNVINMSQRSTDVYGSKIPNLNSKHRPSYELPHSRKVDQKQFSIRKQYTLENARTKFVPKSQRLNVPVSRFTDAHKYTDFQAKLKNVLQNVSDKQAITNGNTLTQARLSAGRWQSEDEINTPGTPDFDSKISHVILPSTPRASHRLQKTRMPTERSLAVNNGFAQQAIHLYSAVKHGLTPVQAAPPPHSAVKHGLTPVQAAPPHSAVKHGLTPVQAAPRPHSAVKHGLAPVQAAPPPHSAVKHGLTSLQAAPPPHSAVKHGLAPVQAAPRPHSAVKNGLTRVQSAPRPHSAVKHGLTPVQATPPHSAVNHGLTPVQAAPPPHSAVKHGLTPVQATPPHSAVNHGLTPVQAAPPHGAVKHGLTPVQAAPPHSAVKHGLTPVQAAPPHRAVNHDVSFSPDHSRDTFVERNANPSDNYLPILPKRRKRHAAIPNYSQTRKSLIPEHQTSESGIQIVRDLQNMNATVDWQADDNKDLARQHGLETEIWHRANLKEKDDSSQAVQNTQMNYFLTNSIIADNDNDVEYLQQINEENEYRANSKDYQSLPHANSESGHGMSNMASDNIHTHSKTNNTKSLEKHNNHRSKVNDENAGLNLMRTKRNINDEIEIAYQPIEESKGVYPTPSAPTLGLSDMVNQLALEVRKLHKGQELYRQRHQSLQQQQLHSQVSTIKEAHAKIAESAQQLRRIQLVLSGFDVKIDTATQEIAAMKHNQQRVLQRLDAMSRSNSNQVKKVHRMTDICKQGLFSLALRNDPDSKVINSTIKVINEDSREIRDDIRNLKENIQKAQLMIRLQAKATAFLEGQINTTLLAVYSIQSNVSKMEDSIRFGQSVRETQVPMSASVSEKVASLKENSAINDKKHNRGVRSGGERKSRKSRHLPRLALILEASDRNVEDTSNKKHEEMLSHNNNALEKPIHAHNKYGVFGVSFNVNENSKINIIDNDKNDTSLSHLTAGSVEESEKILLKAARPILASSCCPDLQEQPKLSETVGELQLVNHSLSDVSTSVDTRWVGLPSFSAGGEASSMFAPSTNRMISEKTPMASEYETESPQLHQQTTTSERPFLLSNSDAALQNTILTDKEHVVLTTSSVPLSISSNAMISPTLSQTSSILELLNFDLSQFVTKGDQGHSVDDLDSSSHWLHSPSRVNDRILDSLAELATASWIATDIPASTRHATFGTNGPHLAAGGTHSYSLESLFRKDPLTDHEATFVTHLSIILPVSKLRSKANVFGSSSVFNSESDLPFTETLLDWSDTKLTPWITSYTPHLSPTENKMSSLSSSYPSQSESLAYFDQMNASPSTPGEPESYSVTSVLDLADIKPSTLQDVMSASPEQSQDIISSQASSRSTQTADFHKYGHIHLNSVKTETSEFYSVTPVIDWPDTESTSLTEKLCNVMSFGAEDSEYLNIISKLSHLAQSEHSANLDHIDSSPRTAETIQADKTTAVIDWPDIEPSSLTEKLQDEMPIGTEESENINTSPTFSHLAQSAVSTDLDQIDSKPRTSDTITVDKITTVIDWSDIQPSLPIENLPDLLSTRVDVGQDTHKRPPSSSSAQSDYYVHLEEMNSSPATSVGSQIYTVVSASDWRDTLSSSSSLESLPDMTSRAEGGHSTTNNLSDFLSTKLNSVSYNDESRLSLVTGAMSEIYTLALGMGGLGGESSLSLGHLIDAMSRKTEKSESNMNSLSDSYSVQSESFASTDQLSFDTATSVKPDMYGVTSEIEWPHLESLLSIGIMSDLLTTPVEAASLSIPHTTYLNNVSTNADTTGTFQVSITHVQESLPSLSPSRNTPDTFERENIPGFNVSETGQLSHELEKSSSQTSGEEYIGYIRHLEERINVLEKSLTQLTSAKMLPFPDVNSLLTNTSTDLQLELETYIQNRTSDLRHSWDREKAILQSQWIDLKQELERQHVSVHNQTSDLMEELDRQKSKTNDLVQELDKQKIYTQKQLVGMKQEFNRQKIHAQRQTSDVTQKLSEQNIYIENQTKSLQEQLQTETANVEHVGAVAARTSMMVTYLARQVSAINLTEFTSRLRESLRNFTEHVLTQEQWSISRQWIVNASLDNEAKISQIKDTLMDTAHSVTKLQGRVRNVHLIGERWYKSLQGHVIRLNNTVQDLRESASHQGDVNRDQVIDYHAEGNAQLLARLDSLNIQLIYNANRLSSLEASMLNLSLTQCKRSSADANQVSRMFALSEKQEAFRKELSVLKDKVNAADLNMFRVHGAVKATEKAIGSLRANVTSFTSVVPGVHSLEKEMANIQFLVPQDCHVYFLRGYSQSGGHVIYPKKLNRTVRVYCLMDDKESCKTNNNNNCRSPHCNKEHIHITDNGNNTGYYQSNRGNNDRFSDASGNNTDNDGSNMDASSGWTVIQRRTSGRLNFTRSWSEYAEGFGTADDDYWAGNDVIHTLTTQRDYELRFLMEDIHSTIWQATYAQFKLTAKEDGYRIYLSGYYGNASDGMSSCNSSAFSTVDFDNDASSSHCALFNGGGWWYRQCHVTNLNGPYNIGMVWFNNEQQDWIQMKSSMMVIRPKQQDKQNHSRDNYF